MKFNYFICFVLLFSCGWLKAQTKSRQCAFKLQLDAMEDRLLAKGWFYQVASKIMHDHAELKFVEDETEAAHFKQVILVRLSRDPASSEYYRVNVGNLPENVVPVKLGYEGMSKAGKTIGNILIKLNSKETPKTEIGLYYESQEQADDNVKFNKSLTECLNDSQGAAEDKNYVFRDGNEKSKNKFFIRGKLVSRTNPAEHYVEHQFEALAIHITITLPKVIFSAEKNQWDPARVCTDLRHDINTLLPLDDQLLIKLSDAQQGATKAALQLVDQMVKQEKTEVALFLLSFLKEKEESKKGVPQKENPALAEIYAKRGQVYLANSNNYNAGNDFQAAMKADKNNIAAVVGYARVLIKTSRLTEARATLNKIEKSAAHDAEYNMAQGELSLQLSTQNPKESENAKIYFKRTLEFENYKVIACQNLAKIYNDEGKRLEAIRYYKLALQTDSLTISPQLAEIYYETGGDIEGDFAKAVKYYDSAIRLDNSNAEYHYSKAYALMKSGHVDSAIQSYQLSIENDPNNEVRYFALGYAYHFKGSIENAISNYSKALEINPEYLVALNNRSILYRKNKNYKGALKDIDKAIAINPKYALAVYNKGHILQDSGEYKSAVSNYSESIQLDPKFMDGFLNRGESYYFLNNYAEAEKDLNHYFAEVKRENIDSAGYYYLGVCEYRNDKYEIAIQNLSTYIKWRNNFFWSYYFRANVYKTMWKNDKNQIKLSELSKQDYKKAISVNQSNLDTYFELAFLCDDLKDFDGAVQWAKKGIHKADSAGVAEDLPELYGNLGWYLYESNKLTEALEASKDALKKNDKLLYVRFNMGLIALRMGRMDESKKFYDEAVKSLINGNYQEYETSDKVNLLDTLGLIDLNDLLKNSQGPAQMNTSKMIEYLESQKAKLKN